MPALIAKSDEDSPRHWLCTRMEFWISVRVVSENPLETIRFCVESGRYGDMVFLRLMIETHVLLSRCSVLGLISPVDSHRLPKPEVGGEIPPG